VVRSTVAVCAAALLFVGTMVAAVIADARAAVDCARTPVAVAPDATGVSLAQLREDLAHDYATRLRFVVPHPDGNRANELSVSDAGGDFSLGEVRVVRAPSGSGWVRATRNTCDD
jgi:hypothetical protein